MVESGYKDSICVPFFVNEEKHFVLRRFKPASDCKALKVLNSGDRWALFNYRRFAKSFGVSVS